MQRKLHSDVFAYVSRGHLPLCGAAQRNLSQLLIITAMGLNTHTRFMPKCVTNIFPVHIIFNTNVEMSKPALNFSPSLPLNKTFEQGSASSSAQ